MKFSTGVILSMLSANVFAIEHLNDAHSGSLLARRAVVADTDSPFLHKRNNGEEQEEQEGAAKSKLLILILTLAKKPYVYVRIPLISIKATTWSIALERGPRLPSLCSHSDDKGKGARKKVYAGPGSGRGEIEIWAMLLEALPLESLVVSRRTVS
ncbi:hypothetical protein BASA83_011781 [Batrachochytrium salamandrivorans]|nr:hypothetical protein BASA83_011781 [Batrachochytrium salamandrivorans]